MIFLIVLTARNILHVWARARARPRAINSLSVVAQYHLYCGGHIIAMRYT